MLMMAVETLIKPLPPVGRVIRLLVWRELRTLARQEFIFFTKDNHVVSLNKVMTCVVANEFTNRPKIVTLLKYDEDYPADLLNDIEVLSQAYEQISIDAVVMTAHLRPGTGERPLEAVEHPQKLPVHRLNRRLGPLPHFGIGRRAAHHLEFQAHRNQVIAGSLRIEPVECFLLAAGPEVAVGVAVGRIRAVEQVIHQQPQFDFLHK